MARPALPFGSNWLEQGTQMDMMAPIRTTVQCWRFTLMAGPPAAAQARRRVQAAIQTWDVPVDSYVAVLLTSELVTNAIMHEPNPDETVGLVITWADHQLRVEVHDTSRSAPVLAAAPPDAETGRGLMLLDTLSTDWGFHETTSGKAVYFTLAS
jgi:hypothetical protein